MMARVSGSRPYCVPMSMHTSRMRTVGDVTGWRLPTMKLRAPLLIAARHWQRAGEDARALRVLLPAVDELVHDLRGREVIELLAGP